MSGFTDMMIDDGFSDPQEYLDHLEAEAMRRLSGRMYEDDYMPRYWEDYYDYDDYYYYDDYYDDYDWEEDDVDICWECRDDFFDDAGLP